MVGVRAIWFAVVVGAALGMRPPVEAATVDDVLARVRADGVVRCAGIVRPGIAVPSLDGRRWQGIAVDVCRAVAAATLGDARRFSFAPYPAGGDDVGGRPFAPGDVNFVSGAQLVGAAAAVASSLQLGPVVAHDAIALLVPAAGATKLADLAGKSICVEAGSPADRALTSYFEQREWPLREHPFQEPDEMRQTYAGGGCAALAGPLSTLAAVRADPQDGHRSDRILGEYLADDPIFAATGGDARWGRIVWWTFSALVDAQEFGPSALAGENAGTVAGVPPAVARELGLPAPFAGDAVAAVGDYGQIFERNLGAQSRYDLPRGQNRLWRDGGLIFGLRVQ